MCCSGTTMALWYFGYSRKNTFSWQHTWKYFWGYFSFVLLGKKLENLCYFSFSRTRNIIFGTHKIGQNDLEIPNLEFGIHCFLENQVFHPTEQTGRDKYMLNDISRHKFEDMSQLVWLEGKHTAQTAHCAVINDQWSLIMKHLHCFLHSNRYVRPTGHLLRPGGAHRVPLVWYSLGVTCRRHRTTIGTR